MNDFDEKPITNSSAGLRLVRASAAAGGGDANSAERQFDSDRIRRAVREIRLTINEDPDGERGADYARIRFVHSRRDAPTVDVTLTNDRGSCVLIFVNTK